MPADGHWLENLELRALPRLLGQRTFEQALGSSLGYAKAPEVQDEEAVGAAFDDGAEAALRSLYGGMVQGSCSQCTSTFGACVHAAVLAVDIAVLRDLREALLFGGNTGDAVANAAEQRRGIFTQRNFERSMQGWLQPASGKTTLEIAASPFEEGGRTEGRAYGDRGDPGRGPKLWIFARLPGQRKLLAPRDLGDLSQLRGIDRRVLKHAHEQGYSRKAYQARGVDASLTLEAMRAHGGIFNAGYKGFLDFRSARVRPHVELGADRTALSATWMVEGSPARLNMRESAFFPGPFPFVWARNGAIFRVAPDVDLELAEELARTPEVVIPAGKIRDAGERILRAARGRGVELPPAEAFGLPPRETPRFALRISGEPLAVEAELIAIYRAREIALFRGEGMHEAEDGRDRETEARAREIVHAAGLAAPGEEEAEELASTASLVVRGENAVAFWQRGLVAVRGAENPAIAVELSKKLAGVRVGAAIASRVHIALEGDWLKTRLEFRTDDLPVELHVIQGALQRKQRWVALRDGTLARISAEIATMADEASAVMGSRGEARLAPHQLGRLDRWLEAHDGEMDAAVNELRKRLRALGVADEPEMPEGLSATLRPYQRHGLAWLQFLWALGAGGVLADDMGLGKTITTLAFLLGRKEVDGPKPSLVVCPTSVASNWVSEGQRFTPDLKVRLLHGLSADARALPPEIMAETDVVVTTYGLLRRDLEVLSATHFRCVVLDEAQNVKNADSATRRAAASLNASMRLALTGTPMENRLRELWSIASLVNPGILGSARSFETRYERPIVANRASAVAAERDSAVAAELRAILRPFLLRRTKSQVLQELPPKTEMDRFVSLTMSDKRMYDALAHTLREGLRKKLETFNPSKHPVSTTVFAALVRLRQMSCDARLVDRSLTDAPSAKRETFLELVRELVSEGRRALVFSQFVELLTLWRQDLDRENIAYEYLDGSTQKREQVVSRFQEGDAPLFLISLKAGGAGLNLTAADTVIHCDPWWNPAVEDQATDRAYRIGQDKPVTVVRLVARGTIEEKILALKAKKRELTRAVVGDDAGALRGLSEEDLQLLLGDVDG